MKLVQKLMVQSGTEVRLAHYDPDDTLGHADDDAARARLAKTLARLDDLQYLMYAEKKRALLIVLQAMDAGGKDGTIRHVMSGVSPQGCRVTSFKAPTAEELAHDFLWRVHRAVPEKGMVGIFNRSHYEDVLVVRVHNLVPKKIWKRRYEEINRFERLLVESGVTILKFFLYISKKEQKRRFDERIADPKKNWKISPADFTERNFWKDYQAAYEDALSRCSTEYAPWFVIPANHKWFRNAAVSRIIVETLESFDMKFPKPVIHPFR